MKILILSFILFFCYQESSAQKELKQIILEAREKTNKKFKEIGEYPTMDIKSTVYLIPKSELSANILIDFINYHNNCSWLREIQN